MPEKTSSELIDYNILKAGAILSVLMTGVLLVFSVVFYKERMLFLDGPHNLFLIINDGHFHIEEHRYGSFITQLLPILGYRLHLPLQWVMMLYSASFNLFFLAVVLLLVFRFREYNLAILFGLYLTLFASATFYWPNNEVHQGTAWLLLVYALNFFVARKNITSIIAVPLFLVSFYLAICTHPLIVSEALFLWFFFRIGKINWPFSKKQSIIYTVVLFGLVIYKLYVGMHSGYDSTKMEYVTGFRVSLLKDIINSRQLQFFLHSSLTNYWLFAVLFISGLIALMMQRKYLLAIITLLSAAGYLLLVCITFRDDNSNVFYIESEYMPMTVICCAAFVYFVLPALRKKTGIMLLLILFIVRAGYIIHAAPAFMNRVAILERINGKMKDKSIAKAIITSLPHEADSTLLMNWGAPVESIFLSKIKGENPQRTFIFLSPDEIQSFNTSSKDTLLGCWEKRPFSRLNSFYFQLDTTETYKVISYTALMK